MTSYVFKVGDKGKTAGGKPYRIICVDADSDRPIVALVRVEYPPSELSHSVRTDGTTGNFSENDLLPPTRTVKGECWINWYSTEDGSVIAVTFESAEMTNRRKAYYGTFLRTQHIVEEFEVPA